MAEITLHKSDFGYHCNTYDIICEQFGVWGNEDGEYPDEITLGVTKVDKTNLVDLKGYKYAA